MAFEKREIVIKSNKATLNITGAAAALRKRGTAPAQLWVLISVAKFEEMGLKAADRYALLMGSGEDLGFLHLVWDMAGDVRVDYRKLKHAGFYQVRLGVFPEFPNRKEPQQPCNINKIESGVEIILPKWSLPAPPLGASQKKAAIEAARKKVPATNFSGRRS